MSETVQETEQQLGAGKLADIARLLASYSGYAVDDAFMDRAREVVSLLLEPTQAMLAATKPAFDEVNGALAIASAHGFRLEWHADKPPLYHGWKAMITTILDQTDTAEMQVEEQNNRSVTQALPEHAELGSVAHTWFLGQIPHMSMEEALRYYRVSSNEKVRAAAITRIMALVGQAEGLDVLEPAKPRDDPKLVQQSGPFSTQTYIATGATTSGPRPHIETDDRYLNLAMINMGEALAQFGKVRQHGGKPGKDYAEVRLALLRALSALEGKVWQAPPNEVEVERN